MHIPNKKWCDLMDLTDQERLEFKKKATKWVTYINSLPRNRKILKERIVQIFKDNRTTEIEIHLWRIGKGWDANIQKWEGFLPKQKHKEKNFGWNFDINAWAYRLTESYKKCNVCGYWFDKRKCETKYCTCCACSDPYSGLGACCEYYNNYTEHNTPKKDEE